VRLRAWHCGILTRGSRATREAGGRLSWRPRHCGAQPLSKLPAYPNQVAADCRLQSSTLILARGANRLLATYRCELFGFLVQVKRRVFGLPRTLPTSRPGERPSFLRPDGGWLESAKALRKRGAPRTRGSPTSCGRSMILSHWSRLASRSLVSVGRTKRRQPRT
jgi:hypothetical protein